MIKKQSVRLFSLNICLLILSFLVTGMLLRGIFGWFYFGPFSIRYFISLIIILLFILFSLSYERFLPSAWRYLVIGALIGITLTFSLQYLHIVKYNIWKPPEFDFKLFYTYGQVISQGLNPYETENLRLFIEPLKPSDILLDELFFFYPPPSVFLFAPLGWFNIKVANILWYGINGIAFALSVFLIWKNLLIRENNLLGLLFVMTLLVLLYPSFYTILTEQTNFIVLLAVILFFQDYKSYRGGIWILIGSLVKPITAILLLFSVIRGYWKAIFGFILAIIISIIFTIIVFGKELFVDYIFKNPVAQKMPVYLYTEAINQSLLGNILRWTAYDLNKNSPISNPLFITSGLVLVTVSSVMVLKLDKSKNELALMLMIPLALIIYPKSLEHYFVLLILPFLFIWKQRNSLPGGTWLSPLFITFLYGLVSLRQEYIFLACLFCWIGLVGITFWVLTMGRNNSRGL